MKRRKGKTVGIVAVAGVLLLTAATILSWNGIAKAYYRWKLQSEPSYLLEMISDEQSEARRMAIQDFMKTRKGREVVLAEFLKTLDSDKDLNITWYLRQLDETSRAAFGYYQTTGQAWHETKSRSGNVGAITPFDGRPLVSSIHSLLRSLKRQIVTLPEYPDLEFLVVGEDEAYEEWGLEGPARDTDNCCVVAQRISQISNGIRE